MPTIHASYKRTFQIKAYEPETVSLSITDDVTCLADDAPFGERRDTLVRLAAELHDALAVVGDQLVIARMRQVTAPTPLVREHEVSRDDPWFRQKE